jgi:hypothetical protein
MKLTTGWQEPAPGVVVITPGGPRLARVLGAALALPGVYFLTQFAGGLVHPGELTIAGWVMLPALAALFLVPGWLVIVGRKRTRLDAPRREASEEFDFLVYTRRKVTAIPREAHVLMRYEAGSSSDTGTIYMLHVYLDPAAPAPGSRTRAGLILLSLFGADEKPAALEFAHKVAGLLGVDVQDRCVESGDVSAAGVVVDRLAPDDAD